MVQFVEAHVPSDGRAVDLSNPYADLLKPRPLIVAIDEDVRPRCFVESIGAASSV